ncbi:Pentatricopeptide repeat-containing protein [Striga hermonthica]|uniref:Pentatricopeptide repeat-containing protein n=1 Tax=Striga hermonthica TaxID=68872 RepID=A0A9N7MXY5_STRHE|nr:Pentatricopeptide repeat-containing protein [Striga hermonthica]
MAQPSNTAAGVDNTFRRKFDREEYLQRARERESKEAEGRKKSKSSGPPVQRKPLKHRDYEVDLESRLGKTQVRLHLVIRMNSAGYYCSVCECVVKDSANYLDHINGKKHQRALGMSMRAERSTLEQVQRRFEVLKKRKDTGGFTEQDFDERILKQQQEDEEIKRQRREKKKEKNLLSHFVSVCASLDRMPYAARVFRQSPSPNILLFNAVVRGHSLRGPFLDSIAAYSIMKRRGIRPDEFTLASLLKACANLRHLSLGLGVHKETLALGYQRFGPVRIGLLELLVQCGRMAEALKLFDEMPHREAIAWNLMILGFSKIGDLEKGLDFFRRMEIMGCERTTITWNTMISCLAQGNRDKDALELFREMTTMNCTPDEATLAVILPTCARLGKIDIGKWVHSYAESSGLSLKSVQVGNSLLDFYSKCGDIERALELFERMPRKNVISYNTMILGLGLNGECKHGIKLFEEMKASGGINPNDSTYVGVLTCCVHAGLVQTGKDIFGSIVEPKVEHYGCMVDLLGRVGCVREAYDLIRGMAVVEPSAALWSALLSGCRASGEKEIAERALNELIKLEPWNSGNYVLLSNMYADRGVWTGVEEVRARMRKNCVEKTVGQSVVE